MVTHQIFRRVIAAVSLALLCFAFNTMARSQEPLGTPDPQLPTLNEITVLLDQEKPDPGIVAKRIADAEAPAPAGADDRNLAKFYYDRAQARSALGRSYEAIADLELAVGYGKKTSNYADELSRYEQFLMLELYAVGESNRATAFTNMQIRNFSKQQRGRLFGLNAILSSQYIAEGDLNRAESYLARNKALFEEARSWKDIDLYRSDYLETIEQQTGRLLEAKRRYAEAASAYHRSQTYYTEAEVQRVKWPSVLPLIARERRMDTHVVDEGRMKVRQGRVAEGEVHIRRALLDRLAKEGKYQSNTAGVLRQLADAINEQGRYTDAEKLTLAAIDIYKAIGYSDSVPAVVFADNELAQILILERRQNEALEIYSHIEEITADWPLWRREQLNPLSRAWGLIRSGRAADVVELATRVLERERARSGDKSLETALVHGVRAAALGRVGREAEALAEFRASVPTLLAVSHEYDDEDGAVAVGRANRIRRVVESYIAFQARNPAIVGSNAGAESFGLADTLRGQAVQRALIASSSRAAAADPRMADVVRKDQDLKKQIGGLLRDLNALLARPTAQRDQNAVKVTQAQIEKLRPIEIAARQDILRRFPKYGNLVDPPPTRPDQIQAVLHADDVVLSFYFGEYESFVWAVPKQGSVTFLSLPSTLAEVESEISKLREALAPDAELISDVPPFDLELAYRLYVQLLKPTESIWRSAKHLIVMTNGPLGLVPLGLLPTAPTVLQEATQAQPLFANYRNVAWLARTHAVTMVPSAGSLRILLELPESPRQHEPFIGFGDPYFSVAQAHRAAVDTTTIPDRDSGETSQTDDPSKATAGDTRGHALNMRPVPQMTGVDTAELARMPRLPDTADELKAMARALKVDPDRAIHLGREANERLVRSLDLSKYRTIAFATHGLLPGDLDGLSQPALALTAPKAAEIDGDGLLSTEEILTLKLDAAWVILSACNSAAGYEAGAEAASGLARAFFYAGTRAVLATNWPVNSVSARLLVSDLFERQAADQKLSRAEAFRQAMVAMIDTGLFIDSTGKPAYSYAHPMFWAAYSLFGDGAGSAEYGASAPPSEKTAGAPRVNSVAPDSRRSPGKVGDKAAPRPVQSVAPASRDPVVAVAAALTPAPPQAPGSCKGTAVEVSLASRRAQPLSSIEECALKQKEAFKECDKCPEMIVVSRGGFTMGSPETEGGRAPNEGPQHEVMFSRPFAVGKFHVTVDQFATFVSETGYTVADICWTVEGGKREERSGRSWRNPGFSQNGSHPAVCVSWNDAQAYVEWLRRKTGKNYRLLTEAEWEYAARARTEPGTYPRYSFGDDETALCRHGNGADQTTKNSAAAGFRNWASATCNDGYAYTAPAGRFAANDFGLYDMQGNALQWTQDCFHGNYNGSPSDGSPWMSGDCGRAIIRGGAWNDPPVNLRPAFRGARPLSDHRFGVGFRVARTLAD